MLMAKDEAGLAPIRANLEERHFVGPRPEELIQTAEAVLGFRLPPAYRRFVSDLSAGNSGQLTFAA